MDSHEPGESAPSGVVDEPGSLANEIGSLGEFGLIARLTAGLESRPDVVIGVGDDAAALDLLATFGVARSGATPETTYSPDAVSAPPLLLATCDAQVEGRHFLRWLATPEEIGRKALAVNLSDIAAMGGEPLWALVSLLTPPALPLALLDGVYVGLRTLAHQHHVAIVGGNVAATDGPFTVDITLLGRVAPGAMITRSGGRPGDALLVVGALGVAAAGLLAYVTLADTTPDLASAGNEPDAWETARLTARQALVSPEPLVAAGRALAATGQVTAGLDVSDGLAADLGHLCERSGVGALVEAAALPIAPATRRIALAYGRDPLALALSGGEDYALLCAVRPDGIARAQAAAAQAGAVATPIGWLTEQGAGLRLQTPDGQRHTLAARGWDHLRAGVTTDGIGKDTQ